LDDIDIGYDAPPASFTANLELEKQRRERIEAAKRRIDAIRKAPAAISNHSQPVPGTEDVYSPQKLPRNKQGRKKMDDRDKVMPRDIVVANPIGPDGSKKRRRRVSLDGIDWEDCLSCTYSVQYMEDDDKWWCSLRSPFYCSNFLHFLVIEKAHGVQFCEY
jgi:transcription factor IIIB 90 kDa subunit